MEANVTVNTQRAKALALALSHFVFAVLLQAEIGLIFLDNGAFDFAQFSEYLLWLPASQFSAVVVGLIVYFLALIALDRRGARAFVVSVIVLANVYLCLAQIFFLAVGEPFDLDFLGDDGGWAAIVAVLTRHAGPLFFVNVFIGLVLVIAALRWRGVTAISLRVTRSSAAAQGVGLVILGAMLLAGALSPFSAIAIHPVYGLVASEVDSSAPQRMAQQPIWNVYGTGFGTPGDYVFFRAPEPGVMWGVRDGQWKFRAGYYGNGARLFDLVNDPFELRNLAPRFPRRVDYYHRLLASRYTNFGGPQRVAAAADVDIEEPPPYRTTMFGPKVMKFAGAANGTVFRPDEMPVLELALLPYARDTTLLSQWAGPAGERLTYDMRIAQRWSRYRFTPTLPRPLSPGQWQVVVKDGDQALIGGDFFVAKNDSASASDAQGYRILKRAFDKSNDAMTFHEANVFDPYDLPYVGGGDALADRVVYTEWWPPSGEPVLGVATPRDKDAAVVQMYAGQRPLQEGRWRVKIVDQQATLAERGFDVRPLPATPKEE